MKLDQPAQPEPHRVSLIDSLHKLMEKAKTCEDMSFQEILDALAKKGYATLVILLSFPFCFPQIPGFSTPFGVALAFYGLRLAFGKRLWWPQWLLKKRIKSSHVEKLAKSILKVIEKLKRITHPRLFVLTTPSAMKIHGIFIFILALFLSLPLPIPLSNILSAIPIFLIGLGLLEDDGFMIILGYFFASVCLGAFVALFWVGGTYITKSFIVLPSYQ